jgi:hypothetical protein
MDVVAVCPLRVGSLTWQAAGAWRMTVVCKATYQLAPGVCALHEAQEAPCERDQHWGDDRRASLSMASDLVPFKRRADVLLIGSAFAPGASKVRSIVARLTVGAIDKALEAYCDRSFRGDGELVEGPGVVEMPLVWERAAGGPGTLNPAGVCPDDVDRYGATKVPNLQPLGILTIAREQRVDPIGFAPIAPSWPMRAAKLAHHYPRFAAEGWCPRDVPADLDASFFNVAPADQQLDELHADEKLALDNLHRDHPVLVTQLPGVRPSVTLTRRGSSAMPLELRADTLVIDTARALVSLVWRGIAPLSDPAEQGVVVVSMVNESDAAESTSQEASTLAADARAPQPTRPGRQQPETLAGTFNRGVPALPFEPTKRAAPLATASAQLPHAARGQTIDASAPVRGSVAVGSSSTIAQPALVTAPVAKPSLAAPAVEEPSRALAVNSAAGATSPFALSWGPILFAGPRKRFRSCFASR